MLFHRINGLKIFLSAVFVFTWSCLFAIENDSLEIATKNWHQLRIASLKAENGWLNLVGLEWLKPGKNSIGSGEVANIKFPKDKFPPIAGFIIWENQNVWYEPDPKVAVWNNETEIKERLLLIGEGAAPNITLHYKSIRWTIIRRDEKMGVRIRDLESEALARFGRIERFPVSEKWLVKARFLPEPKWSFRTIPIVNVLGQTIQMKTPGKLEFMLDGKSYSFDTIEDGENDMLIVFGDETNDVSTYASGRFILLPKPAEGVSDVWIDFNKAYNPPCAFTTFATCPLPPPQNHMQTTVEAGEKQYKKH